MVLLLAVNLREPASMESAQAHGTFYRKINGQITFSNEPRKLIVGLALVWTAGQFEVWPFA